MKIFKKLDRSKHFITELLIIILPLKNNKLLAVYILSKDDFKKFKSCKYNFFMKNMFNLKIRMIAPSLRMREDLLK